MVEVQVSRVVFIRWGSEVRLGLRLVVVVVILLLHSVGLLYSYGLHQVGSFGFKLRFCHLIILWILLSVTRAESTLL
jgi:hypothetical protein